MNAPETPPVPSKPKPREARLWGEVRKRPDRPGFRVRFQHEGKTYERAAGTSWGAADKKRRQAQTLLEAGSPIADVLAHVFGDFHGAQLTFRDAVPLYVEFASTRKKVSTLRADISRLRVVASAPWTSKVLGRVTAADLSAWLSDRKRRGSRRGKTAAALSPSALNRDLGIVSALYRWAKQMGYVEGNPAREVEKFSEKGRARETYLNAEESRALLAASSPTIRPIVLAALHTGMRRGELLALRWRDVDLDRKAIVVAAETEKAGRGRVVPLTATLRDALGELKAQRPRPALDGSDPVFTGSDGGPLLLGALRVGFDRAVAGVAAALCPTTESADDRRRAEAWLAKRDRVTFHALRHSAASLLVGAGIPLLDVARVLGHSTIAVTMRYAHHAPESGRVAIDALDGALGRGAATPKTSAATA